MANSTIGEIAIGNSTIGQVLTSTGPSLEPTFQSSPAISAYDSGGTTLAAATFTKVNLATASFAIGGGFSSSRYTPTKAGIYHVSGQVSITNAQLLTLYSAYIYVNGAGYKQGSVMSTTVGGVLSVGVNCLVNMNGSTDYIELFAGNGSAATAANTQTGSAGTYLSINYVGPAA